MKIMFFISIQMASIAFLLQGKIDLFLISFIGLFINVIVFKITEKEKTVKVNSKPNSHLAKSKLKARKEDKIRDDIINIPAYIRKQVGLYPINNALPLEYIDKYKKLIRKED